MSNFHLIKNAVATQFALMSKHPLYSTGIDRDKIWQTYLAAFPPGTNPIYRERTEHDCSCCKQFIRTIGDVVAIIDGKIVTIWDDTHTAGHVDAVYDVVRAKMAAFVREHPIVEPFLHYEKSVGTDKTFEDRLGASPQRWEHFHVNLPTHAVEKKDRIATILGEKRTKFETLQRAFTEITPDAVDTVLDLIAQGSLYRGTEHAAVVEAFRMRQRKYRSMFLTERTNYTWTTLATSESFVANIRNSVIGTLLVELSEGKDLEAAVKSYEVKVAPTNYKRPTALITQAMIDKAKAKIEELGLTSALDRRYANTQDVSANAIWYDPVMKKVATSAMDEIAPTKSAKPKLDKIESISIDDFIEKVLPKASTLEVMLEGKHTGNLVSLIAPVDPTAGRLFKWFNNFSWAYANDVADSIKERVKAAGGKVDGDLCCRLAWEYRDDLDFHMFSPTGHIYFASRREGGGVLDVDANGGDGMREHPVENIVYANRRSMHEGTYSLKVHNYNRRQPGAMGFDAEIDYLGEVHTFHYEKALAQNELVTVAQFKYTRANGIEFIESLPRGSSSKEVWGMKTNQFQRVKLVTLSPNYWEGDGVGNKHWFFMLDGAKREGDARGIFNEFLHPTLDAHRKVFEVVGSKMKATEGADSQLSGLGFSSTKRDELIVRVTGSFTRTLRITF